MKISIIGAMEEEVQLLRSKMTNTTQETIANVEYTFGQMNGADVILSRSGIGKVNAAISTSVLLDRFKPDVVINTGSAGGFNPELNVGDVVISTEVTHHDVDATIFGYKHGQVPQMPATYVADEKLINVAVEKAKEIEGIQIVKGLIATGDQFMDDPIRVENVRKHFENVQASEMEAAAVAQVCYQFDVPFVIIRSLSDIAGKESNISFDQYLEKAAVNSANLVMKIVDGLK